MSGNRNRDDKSHNRKERGERRRSSSSEDDIRRHRSRCRTDRDSQSSQRSHNTHNSSYSASTSGYRRDYDYNDLRTTPGRSISDDRNWQQYEYPFDTQEIMRQNLIEQFNNFLQTQQFKNSRQHGQTYELPYMRMLPLQKGQEKYRYRWSQSCYVGKERNKQNPHNNTRMRENIDTTRFRQRTRSRERTRTHSRSDYETPRSSKQ